MFTITWQSVLMGILVGVICLLGLSMGLKLILENAPEEGSDKPVNKTKIAIGAVLLGGQFLAAIGILYFTRNLLNAPIGTGIGLVVSIFVGSFFFKIIRKKP